MSAGLIFPFLGQPLLVLVSLGFPLFKVFVNLKLGRERLRLVLLNELQVV